ncbi:cytochrome P450 CYP749A22-like [Populus alba x Populus x berolinensis]|nr:cytochrome P450 CYP749A22-like [Populus alba x Populus x berolinensis]
MMKKREEEATSGQLDGYGNDFFGLLLKAYHDPDNSEKISVDDLIDECKTIYVAGQETTTSLLSWTVLLLAICPDWQDKVRKEVLELIGQQNPCPDSMTKLKIMSMVINESLRLYAPSNYLARKVDKEVRLGNLILPANMEIYMSTLAHHYNPEIWGEDVHLFKPERFAEGVAKATNKSIAAFFSIWYGASNLFGLQLCHYRRKDCTLHDPAALQVHSFANSCPSPSSSSHSVSKAWYSSHSPAIITMVFKPSSHSAPCFIMSISSMWFKLSEIIDEMAWNFLFL